MTLFLQDGHLAPDTYNALTVGALSELQALEVSEHVGYCTQCMGHYLAVLDGAELMVPEAPLEPAVMRQVRRGKLKVVLGKYATVAAAACLVLALWGGGFFKAALTPPAQSADPPPTQTQPTAQTEPTMLGDRLNHFTSQVSGGINGFFDSLFAPAPPAQPADDAPNAAAPQPATPAPNGDSSAAAGR